MVKYNVHVCGCVSDTETDFRCGFDLTVENGGSVGNVGASIQAAIDGMKDKGNPLKEESAETETKKD